ncbi:hypothetical protein GCM10009795_038050 [Nocardioides hankookensis]|uniref:SPW repeat-containing protein n=1 Tax=Nocardioides hankookensis TaxID=443157 RepID=A0ABW1LPT7_9ACTN
MRLVAALGLLLAGAATAIATVALHQLVWGLVLAVVATSITVLALPPGWWTRLAFVLGFAAMLGWLTVPRAEGDYLISQDWQGYAVLGFGMVLLVVGVSTLPRPARPATDAP